MKLIDNIWINRGLIASLTHRQLMIKLLNQDHVRQGNDRNENEYYPDVEGYSHTQLYPHQDSQPGNGGQAERQRTPT